MSKLWRFFAAMVPVAAVLVTMGVSAGTASAGVNVVTAIQHEDQVAHVKSAQAQLRRIEATEPHNRHKLAAAEEVIAHRLSHAAANVSHSSVDSAAQAAGRRDWVRGVNGLAAGFYKIAHALHLELRGDHVNIARALRVAQADLRRGQALQYKGDRELGLHQGA